MKGMKKGMKKGDMKKGSNSASTGQRRDPAKAMTEAFNKAQSEA
jgi:hypothetical protein